MCAGFGLMLPFGYRTCMTLPVGAAGDEEEDVEANADAEADGVA